MNTPKQYKDFPVHIDLGKEPPKGLAIAGSEPDGDEGDVSEETKKFYPSIYLDNVDGLDGLERDGWALIHYRRKRISEGETPDDMSADLEVRELCLPANSGGSGENLGSVLTKLARKAKIKGAGPDAENEDGGYDDEDDSQATDES